MRIKSRWCRLRRRLGKAVTTIGGIALMMLVTFFGTVLAEDSPSERIFPNRLYVGAGAGVTKLDPESRTPALTVGDDTDTGFSVFVGYDLSKYFAVEGYYANLGEAGIRFLGDDVGSIDYDVFGISGIGYLFNTRGGQRYENGYDDEGRYRREGLSGYLRLGVGAMSNDSSNLTYNRDHTGHVSAGIGLEYGWSNGIALRGEVSSYDTDAQYASLSLLKRFGDAPAYIPPSTVDDKAVPAPAGNRAIELPPLADVPNSNFAFARYDLNDATKATLDSVIELLLVDTTVQLQIDGHADSTGPEAFNQTLSVQRATAVNDYLVINGVDKSRISIAGFGEMLPIATNSTREGRAQNRRVEIDLQLK